MKSRTERKNVSWMVELVGNLTNPGELVVHCFAGTFDVTKACLFLPKHRSLVGFDKDISCIEGFMESILEVYDRQLRNPESDLTGSEAIFSDTKVFVSERDGILSN